uniref:Uncharacterized protein n=1 Tax=Arundo donax TaxID=35708 RepID=A0A0A9B8Y5_ARUDO
MAGRGPEEGEEQRREVTDGWVPRLPELHLNPWPLAPLHPQLSSKNA